MRPVSKLTPRNSDLLNRLHNHRGNPQQELDCWRINHELGLQWTVRGIARAIPGRAERKDVCCQRSMVTSSITKARSGMCRGEYR